MKILGIETSFDETAAAIVKDGQNLLSNVVLSQMDLHAAFGGVVPEIAARSHIEVVLTVVRQALAEARCSWNDIDSIAVTYAPGLNGSLLIGALTARVLALEKKKPLIAVHHVEGHVYANYITGGSPALAYVKTEPRFPLLALIVSGAHSQLVLFHGHGNYKLLGQTQDDAVGEAFDKVAKMIGLPYPGGPSIAAAAELGDARRFQFPKSRVEGKYNFSFSGPKTAVLRRIQQECGKDHTFPSHQLPALVTDQLRNDIAASFQRIAVETLVEKTCLAYEEFAPSAVVIAGGVAANQELRRQLSAALPLSVEYAPMSLCTDNAAMIASLGYYMAQKDCYADPRTLDIAPSISMVKTAWNDTLSP